MAQLTIFIFGKPANMVNMHIRRLVEQIIAKNNQIVHFFIKARDFAPKKHFRYRGIAENASVGGHLVFQNGCQNQNIANISASLTAMKIIFAFNCVWFFKLRKYFVILIFSGIHLGFQYGRHYFFLFPISEQPMQIQF